MKKRVLTALFLASSLLISSISPVLAALQPIPVPQIPVIPSGIYQTDLFTGAASYSYPVKVPKGTNDLTPDVSLSYNSMSANVTSAYVGMGWDLNRDYIERDVNFTPTDMGDDNFKLHFKGSVYDLVYVSSEDRFHTKIESNLYIQKLNVDTNDFKNYWQVITPDGTKYRFGYTLNSELVCNGRTMTSKWNLDEVTDTHGNKIFYTYTESSGASYLSKIEYNSEKARVIDFTYTTNPYQRQVYLQGCNVTQTQQLSSIKVKVNTNLVHQFDLEYATAGNNAQLLQSIIERGSTGTASALPATTFSYNPEVKSINTTYETWINHADIDVNLEKTDVVQVDVTGDGLIDIVKSEGAGSNTWKVWRNTGSGWNTTHETWVTNAPLDAKLDRTDTLLVDVTGDLLPDIIKTHSSGDQWTIYRNTGTSWNTSPETWANDGDFSEPGGGNVAVLDVNGDGLADVVDSVWNGSQEFRVFKNTGSSWNGTHEVWIHGGIGQGIDSGNVSFFDANGDGLPDIVETSHSGSNATWKVYKNTGTAWNTSAETWINNANIDAWLNKSDVVVTDINGDGLVDIVKSDDLGSADRWKTLLNRGNSWSTTWEEWLPTSAGLDLSIQSFVQMVDVTGDNMSDIIRTDSGGGGFVTWRIWKNNGYAPHLLSEVHTSQGGEIRFDYQQSTTYDNTGSDSISDLPFSLWLVGSMTQDNSMVNVHQTTDVTTYSYKDGFYDWQDREFRGFGEITETLPNSAKRKYVFHQNDVLKGRLANVQTTDSLNIPYAKTENVWGIATSSGVMTVRLDEEKEYTHDGATASAKVKETEYQYDTYGNVTRIAELGDTSTGSDNRFTYNEYTASPSSWLVNTLKHTYKNASDDSTKVSETYLYYDQHSGNDDAPHFGDVTKEVKWLSGGSNPETNYTYDAYGNVASITDANNHITTYTYDTTKTYPATVTNAKNQTTTYSYDLGTGNLLSQTDQNGLVTSYEYDVFGRVTKEIKPYDNSSYPTKSYHYFWDGIAPEGILVSRRETSSSSATLDTYTISDGLGRTIQTRSDAENSGDQRIVDTFYDPSGQIARETVPYFASSSAIITTPTPPPATKFGDGNDGNITIASNTTETPIDSAVTGTAGDSVVAVGSGLGFTPNQIVLFHQTQGTNAGTWEYARVESYSGTSLVLTEGLTNSYSSAGNNKAQVRVVPQYHDVTVNSGVTWSAKAWNGITGGIFAFVADGTVTVNGTITASAKGFRGSSNSPSDNGTGWQGESATGAGSKSSAANGMGGGGGQGFNGSTGQEGGGAGGGHAASGTNGATGGGGGRPGGTGGGTGGSADLTTMLFGGGGGQGGTDGSQNAGGGGIGGGIIFIAGDTITLNSGSVVSSNGAGGNNPPSADGGGGGGGAGGAILFQTNTITLGTNLSTATGGIGGSSGCCGGGAGGAGAAGRIRVAYETSLTGSTNPSASTQQMTIPLLPQEDAIVISSDGTYITPDPTAKYTEYDYDPLGRVSIVTNLDGQMRTIAYDHWKVTNIDEKGAIKRNYLSAFDKITKIEEVNGATTSATLYTYNSRGELTQIVDDESNVFSFVYDTLSRKTSQTDLDMGTWSYGYDAVGNLTSTTDARNVTTTRAYDELNRLITVNYPTDNDVSYAYDLGKIGTLSIATDSAGTVSYTYDNRLRKTAEARTINGTTKTTSFAYDTLDRLISQTNPDSTTADYTFNNQGEIESLTGIVGNFDYNALGKITTKEFNNGVTTNYTYNTDDFRLNRIQTASLFDKSYTYDEVGNISTITDNLLSKTQMFTYDDLDRLLTASESAGFDYEYEYSSIGNLTKFVNAGLETNYTYGSGSAIPHALTAIGGSGGSGGGGQQGASSSATPVVRSSSSGTVSSGGLTLSKPSGTVDGDLLIMTASADLSSSEDVTYTIPGGWTQVLANTRSDASGAGNNLQVWYKIADSEPADYTITPDHDNLIGGSIIRVDGHDATDPIDVQDVTASATDEADAPAVTTTVDKVLVLRLVTWDQSKTLNAIPSGHSQSYHVDVSGHDNWGGYEEQEEAGDTGEAQLDLSSGAPYVGFTLGIKPTTSGGGEPPEDPPSGDVPVIASSESGTVNTGALTLDKPEGTEEGDLLILTASADLSESEEVTYTVPGGFTQLLANTRSHASNAGNNLQVWYKIAGGSEPSTYTITPDHDNLIGGSILRITGHDPENPIHVDEVTASDTGEADAPAVTTSVANTLILRLVTWDQSKTLNAIPSGHSQSYHVDVSGHDNWGGYEEQEEAGDTGEAQFDLSSGSGYVGYTVAIKPEAGGGEPTPTPTATPTPTPPPGGGGSVSSASATFVYDANGNMTSDGLKLFEYNDANQLKRVKLASNSATLAEYMYDYNGLRMIKKNYTAGVLSNTVYSWTDSFETKVIEGGSTETTVYYFANKELVAKKKNDGSIQYIHTDHLGSTSVVTNQAGSLVESTSYDPWGQVLAGGTQSKFGYTGQEHDSETGLDYYNFRYYNSDIRRFAQPDDIIQNIYNPQSLNRYSYVHNNPLRYTDPSGHFSIGTLFDIYKITNFVSNLFKSPEPQKKLETKTNTNNNNNNKQNTSSNQSGSNNKSNNSGSTSSNSSSSSSNQTTNLVKGITTKVSHDIKSGYVDVGISSKVYGPVVAGGGAQLNQNGWTPYIAGGVGFGGVGVTALLSDEPPQENEGTLNGQVTLPLIYGVGPAFNVSYPLVHEPVPLSSGDVTYGLGYGRGFTLTANYTFNTFRW